MKRARRVEKIERSISARSKDIYALNSHREFLYNFGPWLFPILSLSLLPLFMRDPYFLLVLIIANTYAVLAASWDILGGFAGLPSFGQALFFGIAGYASGFINLQLGLSPWITIPIGAVIGMLVGTLLFAPALRLKGAYFALATLILPIIMARMTFIFPEVFGAEEGLYGLDPLSNRVGDYYFSLLILLATLIVLRGAANSEFGLVLHGIRENELAVEAAGINTTKYKLRATLLSGFFAGLAGSFFAHEITFVGPTAFSLEISIAALLMSAIGGPATIVGPVIGAYLITVSLESLRIITEVRILLYSLILLFVMLFKPEGIYRYLERVYHTKERAVGED